MTHAAINQTVSASIAVCYPNELVDSRGDSRMKCCVVSRRNRPPNIDLTRRSGLTGYQLVRLLKKRSGLRTATCAEFFLRSVLHYRKPFFALRAKPLLYSNKSIQGCITI